MPRTNQRGRNNNPEGRNQFSNGWTDTARDRPFTAAATVAAAVGAGVFLWSRRNQISDQIGQLGEQLNSWRDDFQSEQGFAQQTVAGDSEPFMAKPAKRTGKKSQTEIAEEALTLKETGQTAPIIS